MRAKCRSADCFGFHYLDMSRLFIEFGGVDNYQMRRLKFLYLAREIFRRRFAYKNTDLRFTLSEARFIGASRMG